MTMNEQQNPYFRARKEAAQYDDRLSSREKAAELLGLSASQLANYELGMTKCVPVDSVVMMADLYRAPELKAMYCAGSCPIGAERPTCTQAGSIERLAVRMAHMQQTGRMPRVVAKLLDIAQDGRVSAQERAELEAMAREMEDFEQIIQEMRLIAAGGQG